MVTTQSKQYIMDCISRRAKDFGLDKKIITAICYVESSMNPDAVRFEPEYRWFYQPEVVCPHGITIETEKIMQMCSWGLMQVMGGVLREYGYEGFIHKISIDDQIYYGVKHLKRKIGKYGLKAGVCAYNSGSPVYDSTGELKNIDYFLRVLRNM